MSNLAPTSAGPTADVLLDALIAARLHAPALPSLEPDSYARDHADFELLSDQRALIAEDLSARLARRGDGPVSVLSVGCGDGSLDTRLAAGLLEAVPGRQVRYVGIDPYAGSVGLFSAEMAALESADLSVDVQVAAFADAQLEETFDVVVFVHSMYYVADVAATLTAAFALVRPGGELLVLNAPRAALNALVEVLAPPLDGHRQWFSADVAAAFEEADLVADDVATLEALVDLGVASDDVLDFAVQARLDDTLRPMVRDYLESVSVTDDSGDLKVPHPVDVFRVTRPL